MNMFIKKKLFLIFMLYGAFSYAARLKDIVNIRGIRSNQLIGYGLVIGLSKTGDSKASLASIRSAANLLKNLGVEVDPKDLVSGSYASIVATAQLPAFARNGDKIDIRLSTLGDAKSLAGGTLLMTPMKALDGQTYVMAQGPVLVGQATGEGVQVLTVASVPMGGVVEKEFLPDFASGGVITLSLKQSDFVTNHRIVKAINHHFKGFYANSESQSSIQVSIPDTYGKDHVSFLAELESIDIKVDQKSVVILNEKTGTIVMGQHIGVEPVTISHGNLSITVKASAQESGSGNKKAEGEHSESIIPIKGASVGELIEALNQLGAKPKDLIDILRTMHSAGAIHGHLEVI